MKIVALFALFLGASIPGAAQTRPVAVVHHAVSAVPGAQAAFDRGLVDYYAYNPEAAEHEFYTAADLDPKLAMAYWGIALSNAPNLNVPPTDDRDEQAREAIQQAKALESNATAEDRALIDAAAARLAAAAGAKPDALLATYSTALGAIAAAYPDDPDAVALYAESALYNAIGDTDPGTADQMTPAQVAAFRARISAVLPIFQAGLAKFPKHIGLEHFYIHASQMAGNSALAVDAAKQLAAFSFRPEDSHLTHMPGHTFFDVGMYDAALDVGTRSVEMDLADIACCHPGYYSSTRYYQEHNVDFELYALTETARTADAVAVARRYGNDDFLARQLIADGRWQDVLAIHYTKGVDPKLTFARGIAYAKLGNRALAAEALADLPASAKSPSRAANLDAMRLTLGAEIAVLDRDDAKALQLLTDASAAATLGHALSHPEIPALYYYSPHMVLAQLAMRLGKPEVARAALQVELGSSPGSPAATAMLAKLGSAP